MPKTPVASPAAIPPAPPPAPFGIRALFELRDAKRRWPVAARAAFCMGVPVAAGWALGDTATGLMATIGAFTALYGHDRPYLNRALHLAIIAIGFAVAVGLGLWAAAWPWLGVLAVALIGMVATLLCNALRVGPPGAYMFAMACAVGTGMQAVHLDPLRTTLLVLCGGAFSWLVHMAGALWAPLRPEQNAVAAAGEAIAKYIDAIGTEREDLARHWAALALQDCWAALVRYQPMQPRPDTPLSRLRALGRDLQTLFADAMNAAGSGTPPPPAAAARRLAGQIENPPPAKVEPGQLSIRPHRGIATLLRVVRPGSPLLQVAARVGAATLLAGMLGSAFGLDHAYWAMAAAVLMLYQGLDWVRTLQRGLERLVGTWVGLILAAAILALHPQGLWLVATLVTLQFVIEMTVVRSYTLAVIFITPAALTIAAGGVRVGEVADLLLARGIDTTVGCAAGLLVFVLMTPRTAGFRVPLAISRTLTAVAATLEHLARGAVNTPQAAASRQDLQDASLALIQAYDASVGASLRQRRDAERLWPAVVATQRLADRTLAACWSLESSSAAEARAASLALFGPAGAAPIQQALSDVAAAITAGTEPAPTPELPPFLRSELLTLYQGLVPERRSL